MPKPKGSRDVAPQIRGAFKRAVLQLEQGGKPLSEMIREHLEKDFLNTLKVIAQFTPKELDVDSTVEHRKPVADPYYKQDPDEWQKSVGDHNPAHNTH